MSAVQLKFSGGTRMKAYLAGLQAAVGGASGVRVGFLEDATYPEGDGGARLTAAAKRMTPEQKEAHPDWEPRLKAWGAWQAKHPRNLHIAQVAFWNEFGTATAPARPAFRNMISAKSGEWGGELGGFLRANEFRSARALNLMGLTIEDELKDSIGDWPADNAPLTQYIKGFNKGLTDQGSMQRAVDFEVLGR